MNKNITIKLEDAPKLMAFILQLAEDAWDPDDENEYPDSSGLDSNIDDAVEAGYEYAIGQIGHKARLLLDELAQEE